MFDMLRRKLVSSCFLVGFIASIVSFAFIMLSLEATLLFTFRVLVEFLLFFFFEGKLTQKPDFLSFPLAVFYIFRVYFYLLEFLLFDVFRL